MIAIARIVVCAVVLLGACVAQACAQVQPAVAALRVLSGDGQSQARDSSGNASFAPITVVATDASGNPIANVGITFTCNPTAPMACQLTADGNSTLTLNTDSSGIAILETPRQNYASVVAYGGNGQLTISAAAGSASTSASLTVLENQTVSLKILQGDGQQASATYDVAVFATPLVVGAYDSNNNPINNALVSFSCAAPSGGYCLLAQGTQTIVSATTASTGATGQAVVGRLVCYHVPQSNFTAYLQFGPAAAGALGAYTVTASYRNASVTFHLNASGPMRSDKRIKRLSDIPCINSTTLRSIMRAGVSP